MNALPVLGFIAFLAFGIAQIAAGFIGIEHHLGTFWAWAAVIVMFLFRLMLPMTIGSFFGAMNVWGWHWGFAALFAAPGLAFAIPGALAYVVSLVKRREPQL